MRLRLPILFFVGIFLPGCSLFFGNIRPIDEKSAHYRVLDLAAKHSDWKRIDAQSPAQQKSDPTAFADQVYQSKKNASIISINSACRTDPDDREHADLEALSRSLLLGVQSASEPVQRKTKVIGEDALETTLSGKLNGQDVMLRTVVFEHHHCVYDLMYIARPGQFEVKEKDFEQFLSSLVVKE